MSRIAPRVTNANQRLEMRHASAALMTCAALLCLSATAWASCAEDLTRIQIALPKASPDVQSRVGAFVSEAEAKAKAKDGAGCDAATRQALQLLQLPPLPPLQLSVPMAAPEEPARANQSSGPAESSMMASPDPRTGGSNTGRVAPSQTTDQGASQAEQPGGAGQSQAQTPGQPQGPATSAQSAAQADEQQAQHVVSARDLLGVDVRDQDDHGRTLGSVGNLLLDQSTGRMQYAILESGGFPGWDRNRIVVPYDLLMLDGRWDRPTLLAPASKIENAPRIRERDMDDFVSDPDWRRAVAVYFETTLADNARGTSGARDSSVTSGPRPPAAGAPVESDATGHVSAPKAQPGEGAAGPTASSGQTAASETSTALAAPSTAGGPDPKHGQAMTQRACAACHTFNRGGPVRVGPNLFGVAERPIAGVPGYNYSASLKSHQGQWDGGNFDAFLKSPRGYAPGTYMTFPGISSDQDRQDVIAYLESLKGGTGDSK